MTAGPAQDPPDPLSSRAGRWIACALLAILLLAHVGMAIASADREPHMDETEYLHASWLMANGGQLYRTFFEHHSPFLFKTLEPLAPRAERVDVKPYFVRARILAGAFGLAALLGLSSILWRAAPESAPIAIVLLLATGPMWLRGFAEVRAEPFAMAFFWCGAALTLARRPALAGLGAGLVAITGLWNPKWPLAIGAVGLLWLWRSWRTPRGIVAAVVTVAAALAILHLMVPLDVWWFFNFDVNLALSRAVANGPDALRDYFQGGVPFLFVPAAFGPWIVIPAAILLAISCWFERRAVRVLPLVVFIAAALELRFVLPWPAIWSHYYLMWSVAAAAILALLPSSLAIVASRAGASTALVRAIAAASAGAALLLGIAHAAAVGSTGDIAGTFWISQKYLARHLRPGELVWLEPTRHPVSVRDAHYYWFSVGQMMSSARELRKTPRGARYLPAEAPAPVCAPTPALRYTLNPRRAGLRDEAACMQKLIDDGRARQTIFFDVYEVSLLESRPNRLK